MERRYDIDYSPRNSLTGEEAEELFSKVDNSGHTNAKKAERQRRRREKYGHGVEVDPLSADDPSGSNVSSIINKAAAALVIIIAGIVVFVLVSTANRLSENTANLSSNVSVRTVAAALGTGVDLGNGFTQFPEDYSVLEADQNTGRIEVAVTDTTSANAMACFSNAQVQAAALAVNSLLNPKIDTVIYHVNVFMDKGRNIQKSSFFGFFRPTGDLSPFMTFIWTKTTTSDGQVRFNCVITGVDSELEETLRGQILNEPSKPEAEETDLDALRR